jgi:formylglycine-generating enzyme required for sulfatase activity
MTDGYSAIRRIISHSSFLPNALSGNARFGVKSMSVIFISYRRSDSQDVTGRIYDRLLAKFTEKEVFKDVDSIPMGVSFPLHIKQMLGKAHVVLVVIGPNWLAKDEQGNPRLEHPNDYVRLEIEIALRAAVPVIPVLVSNARMPVASELPRSIHQLTLRNGIAVRPDPDFNNDIARLLSELDRLEKLITAHNAKSLQVKSSSARSATGKRAAAIPTEPLPVIRPKAIDRSAAVDRTRQHAAAKGDPVSRARQSRRFVMPLAGLFLLIAGAVGLWAGGVFRLPRLDGILHLWPFAGNEEITNSIGMKLVPIPAGTFRMGAPQAEQLSLFDLSADQRPQHKVQITRAFYLGKFTVTRGEFRKFVDDTHYQTEAEKGNAPSTWKEDESCPQTDKHPVINVSWNDATAFCDWLSKKENKKYRLPTEAEWEYSCRAGTTTRYHSGDDLEGAGEVAWSGKGLSMMTTSPVGRLDPNAWSLHDMHGNVSQWCQDFYDAEFYEKGEDSDPTGPSDGTSRVVRGGNYLDLANDPPKDKGDGAGLGGLLPGSWRPSTSAYREERDPTAADSLVGFRVLLEQ